MVMKRQRVLETVLKQTSFEGNFGRGNQVQVAVLEAVFQTDVGTVFLARCFCVHMRDGRCAGAGCRPQLWG